ncbi:MAG TPA: hypothetical protein VJK51_03635 [Candidatus Nanoarchaeia archaeon]|nr:hypothetical protein [Candidatus Nanoarchaeia archaeon]
MRFNRAGQLGKIVTALPVLLGLFVVLAGFILLATAGKGLLLGDSGSFASSTPNYVLVRAVSEGAEVGGIDLLEWSIRVQGETFGVRRALAKWKGLSGSTPVDQTKVREFYYSLEDGLIAAEQGNLQRPTGERCLFIQVFGASSFEQTSRSFIFLYRGTQQISGGEDRVARSAVGPGSFFDPVSCMFIGELQQEATIDGSKVVYYYGTCKKDDGGRDIADCRRNKR